MRKEAKVGDKYGRLTITAITGRNKHGETLVKCHCSCGGTKDAVFKVMARGDTHSCGCIKKSGLRKSHGLSKTPMYLSWRNMMNRCYNPNVLSYENYGAKGITVVRRWHLFENFLKDMGLAPRGMTLDRKNPREGYSKENCRWCSKFEQGENRTNSRILTHNGITMHLSAWSRATGIKITTIYARMKRGWNLERTLTP